MTPAVPLDDNLAYWQATAEKSRKEAKDNLRMIAEKNIEIAELRQQLREALAELKKLRNEAK